MRALVVAALACAGCEGLSTPPQPIVSVLVRTTDGCFAPLTAATPPDPVLGVAGTCSYSQLPTLLAGIDFVEVVVDYGPDVDFASGTQAPPPTVTLLVDGRPSDVAIAITAEQRVGPRAYFIATFRVPPTLTVDARLVAGVNPGFQTTVPLAFHIVEAPVELAMLDCPAGTGCMLAGAVGSAHLRVRVPGDLPQLVAVHTTLDGVPQPDESPPVRTDPTGDHTEHTTALAVPAARDGALWMIEAQLGAGTPATVSATIVAPEIASALSCGTSCALVRGQAVGLAVTAPAQIRPLQALVTTALDGVPQLVAAPLAIVPSGDSAVGQLALVAPGPGTWQIDVSVAGYRAPAIVTTVR